MKPRTNSISATERGILSKQGMDNRKHEDDKRGWVMCGEGIAQGVSIPSQEMTQRVLVEDDVEQPRTSAL